VAAAEVQTKETVQMTWWLNGWGVRSLKGSGHIEVDINDTCQMDIDSAKRLSDTLLEAIRYAKPSK
jgi:hypothetical protein